MSSVDLPYARIRQHGLGDTLREQARSRPEMTAVVDGDVRSTFRQLDQRVNRLATGLARRGLKEGGRVLWLAQNSGRLLEVLLACAKLGAIVCPANWRASTAEAGFVLDDFDPQVVFWQDAEIGDMCRSLQTGHAQRDWVQHDGAGGDGYDALLSAGHDDEERGIDGDEPLLAIYTAAFGGRPKAALLAHTTLLLQGVLSMQGQLISEATVYLASGPMFHVGVLMGMLATFVAGGCNVVVPRVVAAELLGLIQSERVTHGYLMMPTIEQMRSLNAVRSDGTRPYDVSSLFTQPDLSDYRLPLVMPAAAPLMRQPMGYGQTEIGGMSVLAWLGGSGAGRPAPFVQVKIVDSQGRECPPDVPGEILVRGALVMCGYHGNAQENVRRTDLGWHHTHDLGLRRADGSLVFVGPKTTMIKSGVENIYPAEVEGCLRGHADVADVCVIGVPDPTWQQNVKALVVLKPGRAVSAEVLIEHCRERIASYKKPKQVVFVDTLPRDASGQLDRPAVDAAFGGGGYPRVG